VLRACCVAAGELMLLAALHLVTSSSLKQQNSAAVAYLSAVVPGSTLQMIATASFIEHVTVHQPDFAATAIATCMY
jgi:hypothetical protein